MRVDEEKAFLAIRMLCEGSGIRSIERTLNLNRRTVLSLLELAGERSAALLDSRIRNVEAKQVQIDELVCYVGCRQIKVKEDDELRGNFFTYLSVDRDSKLILNWRTARHTREEAELFLTDLKARVKPGFQLSSDGWRVYSGKDGAVRTVFGEAVDYATEIKIYQKPPAFGRQLVEDSSIPLWLPRRKVLRLKKRAIMGNPDMTLATTSHCERTNLTVRLFTRRFTKCTMGFSKTLPNLRHAVALFVAFFNFVKVHETLKQTPAMAAGLTDHAWTIEELLKTPE